jgi:hypothetical protein
MYYDINLSITTKQSMDDEEIAIGIARSLTGSVFCGLSKVLYAKVIEAPAGGNTCVIMIRVNMSKDMMDMVLGMNVVLLHDKESVQKIISTKIIGYCVMPQKAKIKIRLTPQKKA